MVHLREYQMKPNSKWSSGRFSLLLLDHDEYYFRWHEAVAHFNITSSRKSASQQSSNGQHTPNGHEAGNPSESSPVRICAPGLLHICANGIFFEPHDISLPIIRATYKAFKRLIPWDISDDDRIRLERLGIGFAIPDISTSATAKLKSLGGGWLGKLVQKAVPKSTSSADLPWELLLVDPDQITKMCCNGAHHPYTKVDSFDPICLAVKPDPHLRGDERSAMELLSILIAIHSHSAPALADKLLQKEIVAHEAQELAHSPSLCDGETAVCRGRAEQVEPLLHVPGRFLLTNRAIHFFAFHKRRRDEPLCVSLASLFRVARRRHMFDPTAVELTQKSGSTYLLNFASPDDCGMVWRHLRARPGLHVSEEDELRGITKSWQAGAVSNYHYLLHLNSMADRSFHDIAQYPVMPWVLTDYTSKALDLTSPRVYRDLSKPVGALNPDRLAELRRRYDAMDEEPRYLYGTHYSAPAYVVYFLVRKAPLMALRYHGGRFDQADRAFSSLEGTWRTCLQNPADVKELMPQFYAGDGDFLLNRGVLPLGVKQSGEVVHDVLLPPWADSPRHFVATCRAALESDHVSAHLHLWVDLIFGAAQRGPAAAAADNLFHPLAYAGGGAAALGAAGQDERGRRAYFDHIAEFGQVPKQLFRSPHPRRTGAALLRPVATAARPPPPPAGEEAGKEKDGAKRSNGVVME